MNQKYTLQITARIQKEGCYMELLSIDQQIIVQGKDFLELCEILGKFHQLAEKLKIK